VAHSFRTFQRAYFFYLSYKETHDRAYAGKTQLVGKDQLVFLQVERGAI